MSSFRDNQMYATIICANQIIIERICKFIERVSCILFWYQEYYFSNYIIFQNIACATYYGLQCYHPKQNANQKVI
jgi:hypothetical protein